MKVYFDAIKTKLHTIDCNYISCVDTMVVTVYNYSVYSKNVTYKKPVQ